MKILIVSTSVVPLGGVRYGGIEAMINDYLVCLTKTGNNIVVAAPIGSKVPDGVVLMETVSLPEQQDEDWITDGLIGDEFDIIHDFSHRHVQRENPRAIHMMWDNITLVYPFKSKQNIVCVSEWQKDRFRKLYNQQAIVGPTGLVNTKFFKPNDDCVRNDRYLFLAKLSPEKGPDNAIQIAKNLGVPLDVVGGLIPSEMGSDYVKNLEELARGSDIKVHFNVTEEEKLRFLQTCKGSIYAPRQDEAHSLALIEAWCCDCPTLVTNTGAFPSLLPPLWIASSQEEFVEKMKAMTVDYRVKEWGIQARELYSVENGTIEYLKLYRNVVGGYHW